MNASTIFSSVFNNIVASLNDKEQQEKKAAQLTALRNRIVALREKHAQKDPQPDAFIRGRFSMFVDSDLVKAEQYLGRYEINGQQSDLSAALRSIESAESNYNFFMR